MIGDPRMEENYWGAPQNFRGYRPCYELSTLAPGSEIAADTVSALAAIAMYIRQVEPNSQEYTTSLIVHAVNLYNFAKSRPGSYATSFRTLQTGVKNSYPSSGYYDELALAACWLYYVTNDDEYLMDAERFYHSDRSMAELPLNMVVKLRGYFFNLIYF